MIRVILLFVAGAALTLLPGDAPAGCKNVIIQKQAVIAYQPVYQAATYQVGAELRTHSSDERIAELVFQKIQAQQLKFAAQPESMPLTVAPEADRWALTKKHCQACHLTNENAKAALDMSDFAAISCDQKLDAIAACLDGAMPKGKPLPPDVLGNLLGEWAGANTVQVP